MIHEVEIKNFQSLKDIKLQLAPFTVIVGRSSSGKSAFTRALRTLTSNRRGHAFITHNERIATITATTDRGTVSLTRGKAAQDNSYTVVPADPTDPQPQRTFTKLGGETPEEVSQFLGIAAKDPINYAGQFDKPYLLDESSGEVARILGALTNVNIIFDGARESNRRKLSHAQTLKTRSADLERITEKIPEYQALQAQDEALTTAERHIAAAQALQQQIETLTAALTRATAARETVERISPTLTAAEQEITALQGAIDRAERILTQQQQIRRLTQTLTTAEQLQAQIAKLTPIATQPEISDSAAVAALGSLKAFTTALQTQSSTKAAQIAAQERYEAALDSLAAAEQRYAEEFAAIAGSLTKWIEATAQTWEVKDPLQRVLTVTEAARVFTQYLEERAS